MMNQYKLSDYLNAINYSKQNLLDSDDITWEKKYPPYVINRCLSQHVDTILMGNEMNQRHGLAKRLQFHFLLNSIRKKRRFEASGLQVTDQKTLSMLRNIMVIAIKKLELLWTYYQRSILN